MGQFIDNQTSFIGRLSSLSIVVKLVVAAILTTTIAVMAAGWLSFSTARELLLAEAVESMEASISSQVERLDRSFDVIRKDVLLLSNSAALQGYMRARQNGGYDYLGNRSELEWRHQLENSFLVLADTKGYLHIRLYDFADIGHELIRVDCGIHAGGLSKIRDQHQVADMLDEYFMEKGRELAPNSVYTSQVSLNRKNGVIEEPWMPTQHYIAAVYPENHAGKPYGMIIVNSNAEIMLDELEKDIDGVILVNSKGGFIKHPDSSKEWGFELGKANGLAQEEPGVWLTMIEGTEKTYWHHEINHKEVHTVGMLSINDDGDFLGLVMTARHDEVYSKVYGLQQKYLLVSSMVIGVISLLTFVLIRQLTQPFIDLTRQADRLIAGEDLDINASGSAEFGRLGRAFSNLVKNLQEKTRVASDAACKIQELNILLEQNVEERTKELAGSKKMNQAILDTAADAIITINRDGFIEAFNNAAQEIFGYRQDQVVGEKVEILIPEKFRNSHQAGFGRYRKTGKSDILGHIIELQGLRQNGEVFPFEVTLSQIATKGHQFFTGIGRDISLRKATEEQMQRAMIAADEANMSKSEFLARMSHEIRTPMNGVMGMAGLLLETELNQEQLEYANVINSSADSLLGIINDILDFSKIEAGKLAMENIGFDLRVSMEEAVDLLAVPAGSKGLQLVVIISPDVPSLLIGDPGRVRQIVINLVTNAIKFTEQGEIVIFISIESDQSERVTLRFEVKDTGIGIPEDKKESLFDAFIQADGSTSRKYGGTGLGLSIAKQLCEMMNGKIGAERRKSGGSCFWFTVCLEKQRDTGTGRESLDAVSLALLKGKRILVADANRSSRQMMMMALRQWQCFPIEAANHSSAISILEEAMDIQPFDAAIIDYDLPDGGGELFGKLVQSNNKIAERTALIIMAISGRRGDAARLSEIGFSAYLSKPVKQSVLQDALRLIFSESVASLAGKARPIVTKFTVAEARTRKSRILLADDNLTNRKVALAMLKTHGFKVDQVCNGKEAVEAMRIGTYDLILMDCHMPEMDGYEATKVIKGWAEDDLEILRQKAATPIVALTANAMQEDREKCLAFGMDDYLAKPVSSKQLQTALKKWLPEFSDKETVAEEMSAPRSERSVIKKGSRNTPGFTYKHLLNNLDGDQKVAEMIVDQFIKDMPSVINQLKMACADNNKEKVRECIHSIKGTTGAVGAFRLFESANRFNAILSNDDQESMNQALEEIEREFNQVKAVVIGDVSD